MAEEVIQTLKQNPPTYGAIQINPGTITGTQIAPQTVTGGTDGNIDSETITSENIETGTITGDRIDANTITADNISTLNMTGKTATFDTGTIGGWSLGATELAGPVGAKIRSGQTDFNVGTGFWLGNVAGVPKFSIGASSGNQMSWDGTNLRISGALTPTTVFNVITYTTATLPQPPTSVGFSNPSAVE